MFELAIVLLNQNYNCEAYVVDFLFAVQISVDVCIFVYKNF